MLPLLRMAMPDGRFRCVRVGALLQCGADLHQERVHPGIELDDAMRVTLDDVDVPLPVDSARVLPVGIDLLAVVLAVAACHEQLARGVEHHDRLGAPVEHVDPVGLIDGQT
jgi:hypothetical protein